MNKFKVSGSAIVVGLAITSTAFAAEFMFAHERNDRNVSTTITESHKNLYAIGATVNINSNTTGDLTAAGGQVTVNGNVEKDLNVAGGNLNINGSVGDDLRAAGGNISINSPIGGDLLVCGGNITLAQKANVGGDLVIGGGNIVVDSVVAGKANLNGGNITINGQINGDLTVMSKGELTFGPGSIVTGKILYSGLKPAVVKEGAKVGTIEFTKLDGGRGARHAFRALFAVATLIKLIALLVAGFVFYYLMPAKIRAVDMIAKVNPLKSLGIGLLALIVSPILAVVLFITVIGMYLGIIILLCYLLMLVLASIQMLFYTGSLVYGWYQRGSMENLRRDLILGAVIILILSFIPFLGWLALAIIMLITFGALVQHFEMDIRR